MTDEIPVLGKTIGTQKAPAPTNPVTMHQDTVRVVQRRPYLGAEDRREIDSKPYEVSRQRAAELVARDLAEYADVSDADKQTEDDAERAADAARASRRKEIKR